MLNGEISHDQVSRFLRTELYGSKELWNYIKPQVRQHEEDEGVLLLDDTVSEKSYTDENTVNCWHFSHANHRQVRVLIYFPALFAMGISLPIGYEAVKKELLYSDIETRKQKRKSMVTKNEQFRSLIQQVVSNHILFNYVLADNWFGSKDNMMFIHQKLKKRFIFGIKSNRCVALTKRNAKSGQFQQVKTFD